VTKTENEEEQLLEKLIANLL